MTKRSKTLQSSQENITTKELEYLIERYYQVQKHRIAMGNEVFQLEQEGSNPVTLNYYGQRFKEVEDEIAKTIEKAIKNHEMYDWLKQIKGIGPILGAALVAFIDIERAEHASSVWKYCGLAPDQKREKGKKLDYNPFMKTIAWKIGESFVKTKGVYRGIYDTSRAYYDVKFPEKQLVTDEKGKAKLSRTGQKWYKYTDGHKYAMAKRRTVKLFLSHFWAEWRERRGLPVSEPFAHRVVPQTE